mmetsp:Transcript_33242/g.74084  ORF Transcript_33242/g.74084 Transcript_33242/m.74084 type:complete len:143 (+) Transcript_33242:16-444(+)
MAHRLPHLHTAWEVEEAVASEDKKVVCLRLGHDYDPECVLLDDLLLDAYPDIEPLCKIYLLDIQEVPEFTQQYELYDPCTLMFFYRSRHVQLEFGMGDQYKATGLQRSRKEVVDLVEAVHRGSMQGRSLIVVPQENSLLYRY